MQRMWSTYLKSSEGGERVSWQSSNSYVMNSKVRLN